MKTMQPNLSADIAKASSYFGERLAHFGPGISALDYGSRESQMARFNVLIDACDYRGKSVLDVGCGLGDFGVLLKDRVADATYVGVDVCPGMVQYAQSRGLDARQFDILTDNNAPVANFVIANGIFYLLEGDCEQKMFALISRMFELACDRLIFTSLSNWAQTDDDDEFRADPLRTLDFCRSLSPFVCLRLDYLPHDFCVSIRKAAAAK